MRDKAQERKRLKIALTIFGVILLALSMVGYLHKADIEARVSQDVRTYGLGVIFVFCFFFDFIPQFFGPAYFLMFNPGFDSLGLLIAVSAGSTAGSLVGFEVGRRYGARWVNVFFDEKEILQWEERINKWGVIYMAASALTLLPYQPLIFGSMHFSRRNFLLYGVLPSVLSFMVLAWIF